MIGDLLVERARQAEQRCRDRLACDLAGLAESLPAVDAAFDPARRHSQHEYDVNVRIRVLEAYGCEPCDMCDGIDADPAISLSAADEALFWESVALILSDQDHFARGLSG